MKVIHFITGLATGGAESALYNLLQGGLAERFENHVVSLTDKGTIGPRIQGLGVPLTALGMRTGRPSAVGLWRLRSVVRDFQPDVLQGWMYHGNMAANVAHTFAPGRPALAWNVRHSLYGLAHEKYMTRQVIRVNRFLSRKPGTIIYNSRLSREQHEAFGFYSHRGQVIPNGINLRRFAPSHDGRQRVRHKLGIPEGALVVGHVARLHPMKDHEGFLRAAVKVASKHSEVHFLLSGCDVSFENPGLASLVPAWAQERFHLLGERDDVPYLMSAMDVFCQSSWSEAWPNVLGEAMATGVPCVATDVGDSADIVEDTGAIVQPRDSGVLAGAIEGLLAMPSDERLARGVSARAQIETNYALKNVVDQYAAVYIGLSSRGE